MKLHIIKEKFITKCMRFVNQRKSWNTERKILVIESDDWGAIRMPNKEVYNELLKKGVRVDNCNYCKNDTIADKEDLEHLFETLYSIKNNKGQSAKLTANTIVANPDFEKIKADDFQNYYFETIEETFKRYPNRSLKYWNEGIESKVFKPQLHGREHVNIERWMKALQEGSKEMKTAFEYQMYGISSTISNETSISYLEALNISNNNIKEHIDDAVRIFKELFGFHSETFIAPNYCWNHQVEKVLKKNNIYGIQGGLVQLSDNRKIYHYLGERNKSGQVYLTRNVLFEPALKKGDAVNEAFYQIKKCFENNTPAIICSHRLNFIGAINEKNRVDNLKKLKDLLVKVIDEYPEVEFLFSDELYNLIKIKA